jgi:hypothetical protein
MVTAALKFVSDEKAPIAYTSQDEARLDILNTLNWYRRELVNDVFVALQKAGNVRVGVASGAGVFGTPESMKEKKGGVGKYLVYI